MKYVSDPFRNLHIYCQQMQPWYLSASFGFFNCCSRSLSQPSGTFNLKGLVITTIQRGGGIFTQGINARAGRRSWGMVVLSQERTERSRTIQSFRKKNELIERILKNVGTICKGTEQNGTEIAWKERLKLGTHSCYQELILSREHILNQECVLNHLGIINPIPAPLNPMFDVQIWQMIHHWKALVLYF